MAERRKHKKRIQEVSEPTKDEKAVAKYLRFNCPTKSTNMMGHRVDYFIASKAVDCLLDSKWAKAKKGEEALFTTRESVVEYCNRLLKKQFFHRALKDDSPGTPKKKKDVKKKFKLEPHEDQLFLDGNEVFVWIYDPVHFKTFAMGLILEMRVGVYYLSVAAGCFVASILLLAVARCILFLLIWVVTGGRHHFWFLPNLTADVGFIDSFRPLYTHDYKGPRAKKDKMDDKEEGGNKKSDSDEKSDSEKKDGDEEEEEEEEEEESKEVEESKEAEGGGTGAERHSDTDSDRREDEGSQHSNGNDFEMITREELEQHTEEEEEEEEEEERKDEEEERKEEEKKRGKRRRKRGKRRRKRGRRRRKRGKRRRKRGKKGGRIRRVPRLLKHKLLTIPSHFLSLSLPPPPPPFLEAEEPLHLFVLRSSTTQPQDGHVGENR
ncbi:Translocation protein SEC62 [Dissostichus eleginoides]|uniref:Translocation protein SEC62 n=1 Tax=Dissostichus eleginoides TaxID=100907 RepID=A0AAD9BAC0_DISEL|nr:Translocation protein SEC62 [Dissostichus eleginoides]